MNGYILLIIVGILALAAMGLWKPIYGLVKKAVPVSPTLDASLTSWLNSAQSAKDQGLLRMVRIDFKARGDTASVANLDTLIAEAAKWDDVPPPKQPANIVVATTP